MSVMNAVHVYWNFLIRIYTTKTLPECLFNVLKKIFLYLQTQTGD